MMGGIMGIKRCGQCHFGKIISQDLTKRLCHGAPPSAIQIPAPGGQMTLKMARPVVSVSDEACGLFLHKNEADKMRDNEAVEQLQRAAGMDMLPPIEVPPTTQ